MLSYESWRAKKPQLLWPPLISVSYCISLQTALWSCCYAILCIILAFRTGINRFKCLTMTFLILILVFSAQDTAFLRGQAKQPKARTVVKIATILFFDSFYQQLPISNLPVFCSIPIYYLIHFH